MNGVSPHATTPLPIAYQTVTNLFAAQALPGHAPIVVQIGDLLPNIDLAGRGPREYPLQELFGLPLQSGGDWLAPGMVAWSGDLPRHHQDLHRRNPGQRHDPDPGDEGDGARRAGVRRGDPRQRPRPRHLEPRAGAVRGLLHRRRRGRRGRPGRPLHRRAAACSARPSAASRASPPSATGCGTTRTATGCRTAPKTASPARRCGCSDAGNTVESTTATDAAGNYRFTARHPGQL